MEAERDGLCVLLCTSLRETEGSLRAAADEYKLSLQATRQRAAQMLAMKDAALSAARAKREASTPETPATGLAMSTPTGRAMSGVARADVARADVARADVSEAPIGRRSMVSVGVGTEASAAPSLESVLAASGASPDHLASRFARRIGELEAALTELRTRHEALEATRLEDERKRRALRVRLTRHEKSGGADFEYLRNILLRWFGLPPAERGALFAPIAAACAFTPAELDRIEHARRAHAASSSWLGRWTASTAEDFADGPPGTPLVTTPKPARPPAASPLPTPATDAAELVKLREKVAKLRRLLQCANAEIQRLKDHEAGEGTRKAGVAER